LQCSGVVIVQGFVERVFVSEFGDELLLRLLPMTVRSKRSSSARDSVKSHKEILLDRRQRCRERVHVMMNV